jgi:hypothetical protein
MPCIAAPMPVPTMPISEIGVFRTRSEQALRHAHRAAHLGDVLAHDEDVLVLAHRRGQGVADCFAVRQLSHYA